MDVLEYILKSTVRQYSCPIIVRHRVAISRFVIQLCLITYARNVME